MEKQIYTLIAFERYLQRRNIQVIRREFPWSGYLINGKLMTDWQVIKTRTVWSK